MRLPCFNMDLPDPPAGTIMTNGSIFGIAMGDGNIATHGSFWVTATASETIRPFDPVTMDDLQPHTYTFTGTAETIGKKLGRHKKPRLSLKDRRSLR